MQKNVLLPGDSTVVELVFNTKTYKNKMSKNATIHSNDSTQAQIRIYFNANIIPETDSLTTIKFHPAQAEFTPQNKKVAVTVENRGINTILISQVSVPDDPIKLKIKDEQIKPHKEGKIEFEWNGDFPKLSVLHTVTFEAEGSDMPRFTIPYVIKGAEDPKATVEHKPVTPPQAVGNKPGQPNVKSQTPTQPAVTFPNAFPPRETKAKGDTVYMKLPKVPAKPDSTGK